VAATYNAIISNINNQSWEKH